MSTAPSALETSAESLRVTEQVITQARTGLRLAQVRYSNQLGSLVELSSTEVASAEAEASYAEAAYNYKEVETELRHAIGQTLTPRP